MIQLYCCTQKSLDEVTTGNSTNNYKLYVYITFHFHIPWVFEPEYPGLTQKNQLHYTIYTKAKERLKSYIIQRIHD